MDLAANGYQVRSRRKNEGRENRKREPTDRSFTSEVLFRKKSMAEADKEVDTREPVRVK